MGATTRSAGTGAAGLSDTLPLELRALEDEIACLGLDILAQWDKFEQVRRDGHCGAPLAQIDRKLRRLELEQEQLEQRRDALYAQLNCTRS